MWLVFALLLTDAWSQAVGQDEMAEKMEAALSEARCAAIEDGLCIDRIVALGEPVVVHLGPYVCGPQAYVAIEALVGIGSQEAQSILISGLRREWAKAHKYSFKLQLLVRAVRHARIHAVEAELREMLANADEEEPADSPALTLNLEAAATLMVVGSYPSRVKAQEFVVNVIKTVPMGEESHARDSLLVAAAVLGTNDSLDMLAKTIAEEDFVHDEVFRSLTRDTWHKGLVLALRKRVAEMGAYASAGQSDNFAAFEALSEMPLTDTIVPPEFWQKTWDDYKQLMVGPFPQQASGGVVAEYMLTERMKRVLKKRNIHL